jgi:preprotein translocase subunit YajC
VELILFALPVLLLILMFNSQRKRQRTVEQLQASLQPGQQVVTTSGLFARVVALDDAVAVLEVAPGQQVRWDRRAIGGVVADGAPGSLTTGTSTTSTDAAAESPSSPVSPPPGQPGPTGPTGSTARPTDEI